MITILYYPDSTTHCAIALTGLGQNNFYLSFMPNDVGGSFRLHKMADDFKHRATQIINIPSEESCGYGLSEQAILNWYKTKFINNPGFSHLTYNCSTVAFEALKAGQEGSKSLGNKLIKKKDWWFDLPYKIMDYATNLVSKIQTRHIVHLRRQDNWVTNKIMEMENLYNAASDIPQNEFIYSYFIKAIQICTLEDSDNSNAYNEALKSKFINSFIKTLASTNVDTALVDKIKKAFTEKNQNHLLELSQAVYGHKFDSTESKFKNILSFFNVSKPVKQTNHTTHLKKLIDDTKNPHKDYFEKKTYSPSVVGSYYRAR